MFSIPKRFVLAITLSFMMTTVAGSQDTAKRDSSAKVSSFAPVKEVEKQLQYFVDKIGRDLADPDEYGESEQRRVGLDGSTVAVLALTLGMHDEETKLKESASKLIELSSDLVYSADTFADAKQAHSALKAAVETKPKGEKVSWDEPAADLAMLMEQVPIVNDQLRRGVSDRRRFKRNAKRTAGRAVTLAAIAHASMMDTTYCGDEDDEKAWKEICADMRDACREVYEALMKADQEKAKAANAKVVETCDACHHRFRD